MNDIGSSISEIATEIRTLEILTNLLFFYTPTPYLDTVIGFMYPGVVDNVISIGQLTNAQFK